jgi:hypothetical protein
MFFKKKTIPKAVEFINCIVLEKIEKSSSYFLSLEDFRKRYGNDYLWNYIQRDLVVSILSDFSVYIYTPDDNNTELKEDFGYLYDSKESKDGRVFLYCHRLDYRIVTELIEAYDNMWQYNYFVNFTAYSEKVAQIDFGQLMNYEQLKGFAINIKPLGDNTGIEILIDPEQITETELIERVRSVVEKYRMELKVI